jgi:hypothetical protein
MFARAPIFFAMICLSACIAQNPQPDPQQAAEVVSETPVEIVVAPEVIKDPAPDACEILLTRLEETQPLLDNLDESLARHAERIEEAIERANEPTPALQIQGCPTLSVGVLGSKGIIGSIEWLYMDPPGHHYRARIDSGAETSSLSASDVVEFERDGDSWVRFTFEYDIANDPVEFELPISRTVLIRQASSEKPDRRVVVELDIRLGDQLQTTEFTLTDRSRMTYPVLLGRAFLMDLYVIDVSKSYTHKKYEAR